MNGFECGAEFAPDWLVRLDKPRIEARFERGFLSARTGWALYVVDPKSYSRLRGNEISNLNQNPVGGMGLLSAETGRDGLFASEALALRAGQRFLEKHSQQRRVV